MSREPKIAPAAVIQAVEMYVDDEIAAAAKYDNREPLDDSGVYSLHALAAEAYAAGWRDGEQAQAERDRGRNRRDRAARRAEVGPS